MEDGEQVQNGVCVCVGGTDSFKTTMKSGKQTKSTKPSAGPFLRTTDIHRGHGSGKLVADGEVVMKEQGSSLAKHETQLYPNFIIYFSLSSCNSGRRSSSGFRQIYCTLSHNTD